MMRLKKPLWKLLILLLWLAVWEVAALIVDNVLLFPSPVEVMKALGRLLWEPRFYRITATSVWNVLRGILYATVIGCVLSLITYRIRFLHDLITPMMTVIKATPVASFIVLTLIWIGSERVPTLITFMIVLPVVWTNLEEGLRSQSAELKQVTEVFRFSRLKTLRYLTVPAVKPYFVSACRTAFGLAWKAGIAAEIIATPRNSIGTMIGDAKQYLNTDEMFAWTLIVILLSLALEAGFMSFLNRSDRSRRQKEDVC